MNKVGIHIRLIQSLKEIIDKAIRLRVPFFQTFLTFQSGKHIKLDQCDMKDFLSLRHKYFQNIYLHGSYWINLCTPNNGSHKTLEKEIHMAKKLEFTHIVLHPGSATGCKDRIEGIDYLVRYLNKILKYENDIKIILENTVHSNLSIGGDLNDFNILLNKIDYPDKISFCIDTAHAYCFGYDISQAAEQDIFISKIDSLLGKDKIALIHLNDTNEQLGLKIDRHEIPGQGNIGIQALTRFISHEFFINVPIIIETPTVEEHIEIEILDQITKWKL